MQLPNKEHKDLVIHLLKRTLEYYKALKNREDRRLDKRYLTTTNLLKKMEEQYAPDVLNFRLLRTEYRLVQEQVTGVLKVLETSTIPTYMNRLDNLDDLKDITIEERDRQRVQLEAYLAKNKHRVTLCKDILKALDSTRLL